jgi:hypothetical protein
MNARLSNGNVLRSAKRILGLAGLASLALVCAGAAWAQSRPTQTQSTAAPSAAAVPATSPGAIPSGSAPDAKQVVAQNSPAKPSAPKGQSEGIKVHGHWIIEVRNPDGKVVTHREFENALVTGTINDGGAFLASILGRVVTPGSWAILLFIPGNGTSLAALGMDISEPGSPEAAECTGSTATFTCSNTLSLTAPSYGIDVFSGETLTLTGSGPVPSDLSTAASPAQIALVQTKSITCANGPSVTPSSCSTSALSPAPLGFSFTSRTLDGINGDPSPVPVASGQTVQVTVVFSFQ